MVNDFFAAAFDLKFPPDVLELVSQSFNVISGFEADIRSIGIEIPVAFLEAHGFISTKYLISLQLTQWPIREKTSLLDCNATNPPNMVILSVGHFHSITHVSTYC